MTRDTSYSDTTVAASTTYTYQVSAVDAAGNESSKANASVTTPGSGGTLTFSPTDDVTLLKFDGTGTSGCTISSAKLRLTVGSNIDDKSVYGGDVYSVASNSWSESSVNWNTAPAAGTKVGSVTTAVALNTSYEFDVKPLITGNGTVSMMVKSTSSDGARYYSKEGGTAAQDPQLQVTCG